MTTDKHHLPDREKIKPTAPLLQGAQKLLLWIGVAAWGLSLLGGLFAPKQFAFSYLFSFSYFWTIAMGAFFWIILHHATDSDWSVVIRRIFENITVLFPLLAVLFIPLLPFFWGSYAWKWLDPSITIHDSVFPQKWPWFEPWFYGIRWFIYFAFFALAGWWYRKLSVAQDFHGNPIHTVRMQWWAPVSIIGFGLCLSFSAIDWLMTLDYHWYSTMWGVYIFAGSTQSSMAVAILVCYFLKSQGYLKVINQEHAHIMGKLLFAFTIFWAYIAFSQYMLIWYANLPEETIFFIKRNEGSWWGISLFLVAGQFVFPFLFLLTQYMKRSFFTLSLISCWILLMHFVDLYWIVLPNLHPHGMEPSWLDLTCWVGIGAPCLYLFLRATSRVGLFPARDPRVLNSLHIVN